MKYEHVFARGRGASGELLQVNEMDDAPVAKDFLSVVRYHEHVQITGIVDERAII